MKTLLRLFTLIIMLFGLFKCKDDKPRDELYEKFKAELAQHNLKIESVDKDSVLTIDFGKTELKVSLDNLRKNYAREKDTSLITDFVNSLRATVDDIPEWEIAKDSIYYSLFPSDFDYSKVVNQKVSEEFNKVYIYCNSINNTWITKANVAEWNISNEEIEKQTIINVNKLLKTATLTCDTIEGKKLGYFALSDETLKGSLLFSTELKEKVSKDFGWPILAVIPVRDFCYIFSEKDREFFVDRLSNTVVKEYKESGYPITTEILKISDNGVEAIGNFDAK